MTAVWPADVNQNMIAGSYSEKADRNVATFQPEVGPPIERMRTSISTGTIQFNQLFTAAERSVLNSFYKIDLKDGVLPFTRKNPATSEDITCKFADVISYQDSAGGKFVASLQLRLMP